MLEAALPGPSWLSTGDLDPDELALQAIVMCAALGLRGVSNRGRASRCRAGHDLLQAGMKMAKPGVLGRIGSDLVVYGELAKSDSGSDVDLVSWPCYIYVFCLDRQMVRGRTRVQCGGQCG